MPCRPIQSLPTDCITQLNAFQPQRSSSIHLTPASVTVNSADRFEEPDGVIHDDLTLRIRQADSCGSHNRGWLTSLSLDTHRHNPALEFPTLPSWFLSSAIA